MEICKNFDYFGYTAQFRINGNQVYKSAFGGIVSIFFLIFALTYFFSQFYNFISRIHSVKNSRVSIKLSDPSYLLTTSEIYMGLGLIDSNLVEFNTTESFPYLEFGLTFNTIDEFSNKKNTAIPLEVCKFSLLMELGNLNKLDNLSFSIIEKKVPYYVCPVWNSTFNLTPYLFGNEHTYLEFTLSLKKTANLSFASLDLSDRRPRLNIIYKQIGLNLESKYFPVESFIKNTISSIDFDYVKHTKMGIFPFEIMDDLNFLTTGEYQYYKNPMISSQTNGTIFSPFLSSENFEKVYNRNIPLKGNNNEPLLYLAKCLFKVRSSKEIIFRTFAKFSNFLAATGAIISNLLIIVIVIMSKINEIKGKNMLLESMFSYDRIKNVMKFSEDVKLNFNKIYQEELKNSARNTINRKATDQKNIQKSKCQFIINQESQAISPEEFLNRKVKKRENSKIVRNLIK